jgi:hypothetical protein
MSRKMRDVMGQDLTRGQEVTINWEKSKEGTLDHSFWGGRLFCR